MSFFSKLSELFCKKPKKEKPEEKQEVKYPSRESALEPAPPPEPKPVLEEDVPWVYPDNHSYVADPDGGKRPLKTKDNKPAGIVIHHTATYNLNSTVNYFKKNVVDVHFLIGHDGKVVQMVQCNRTAAHAGKSEWNGLKSLNNYYIGIEVINIGWLAKKGGKFFDGYKRPWSGKVRERDIAGHKYWEPFTKAQEMQLHKLCVWLAKTYDIPVHNITGHFEVSPGRKNDPAGGLSKSMDDFRLHVKESLPQR